MFAYTCFSRNDFNSSNIPTSVSMERWIIGPISFERPFGW
jgi:hypothetical protein